MRLLAALALLCTAVPANAKSLAFPDFKQCVVSAGIGDAPVSLSYWTTSDPSIVFVATGQARLTIGRKSKFQSYLARLGGTGQWRLWLVPVDTDNYVPPSAKLVTAPGSARERAFEGQQQGDWLIYNLDPAELLAAYPGQASVSISLLDQPAKSARPRRGYANATIDLARLRALQDWLPELERRAKAGSCAPSDTAPIEPLNPRAYSLCETDSNPWADWWQGYVRVAWQRHLHRPGESYTYLDFRVQLSASDAEPLLSEPTDPANDPLDSVIEARLSPDWIDLSKRAGIKVLDQQKLRVRLTGDWGSTEMMLLDVERQWGPPLYRKIVHNQGDLRIEMLSPQGRTVQTFVVPAGTFAEAKRKMRASLQTLATLLRDPMRNCQLAPSLVVT